jgi:hypothetical protein
MTSDSIDYQRFVEDALRDAVRRLLAQVAESGMPGESYFYIGFRTGHAGVTMPRVLRDLYPEEMTIILQHQYWNLEVEEDGFCVELSFSGSRQQLCVPFAALTTFADPSAEFALRFVPLTPGAQDARFPMLGDTRPAPAPAERPGPRAAPDSKSAGRRPRVEPPAARTPSAPLAPLGVERVTGAAASPLRMPVAPDAGDDVAEAGASGDAGDTAEGSRDEGASTDASMGRAGDREGTDPQPQGEPSAASPEAPAAGATDPTRRKPGEVIRFDPSRRK